MRASKQPWRSRRLSVARSAGGLGYALVAVGLAAGLSLGGCVTERVIRPTPRPANPLTSAEVSPVRFSVQAIGAIRYDGLTLPLVSPDGRWVASQVDRPPGWPGLLATPGDPHSALCRIAISSLSGLSAEVTDATPPRGLVLGRHADNQGFLVEEPLPDGSRRIGRCVWLTGGVEWLVDEPKICAAHAIELRDGTLVYTRRKLSESRAELIFQPPKSASGGEPAVISLPDASLMFPLATPSQAFVTVLAASRSGLELVSVAMEAPGSILARCRVSLQGGPQAALRAVASTQATPPDLEIRGETGSNTLRHMVSVHAERFEGVVLVNARDGQVVRLSEHVVAASLWQPAIEAVAGAEVAGVLLTRGDVTFAIAQGSGVVPQSVSSQPLVNRVLERGRVVAFGPCQTASEPMLNVVGVSGGVGVLQGPGAR